MQINVLGSEWSVEYRERNSDVCLKADETLTGYTDKTTRRIVIRRYAENELTAMSLDDLASEYNATLRHELVHAFLYESGLHAMAEDEILVEWVAAQFPKLLDTFTRYGIAGAVSNPGTPFNFPDFPGKFPLYESEWTYRDDRGGENKNALDAKFSQEVDEALVLAKNIREDAANGMYSTAIAARIRAGAEGIMDLLG